MELNFKMTLREANLNDLPNIAELHAQSWRENYSTVLASEYLNEGVFADRNKIWTERLMSPALNQQVLIAEDNGNFCGFICLYGANHPEYGSIVDNLHVNPKMKGQGLGRKLLIAGAKWANSHYKDYNLYLEVLECNDNAISFYEFFGGKNIDTAYWHTPCGNKVKEFIYSWCKPEELAKK